jgi:hypothetical protein
LPSAYSTFHNHYGTKTHFSESDIDKDGRVSRTEFTQLVSVILRRATSRLVAHKLVTLIGAPLLAAKLVKVFKGQEDRLPNLVARIVPPKLFPFVTNVRTFLLVGLVASLGSNIGYVGTRELDTY